MRFILSSRFGCERAMLSYTENILRCSWYTTVARSQPKRDERMKQEATYLAAKTRIFQDKGQGKQLFTAPWSKGISQQRQTAINAITDS